MLNIGGMGGIAIFLERLPKPLTVPIPFAFSSSWGYLLSSTMPIKAALFYTLTTLILLQKRPVLSRFFLFEVPSWGAPSHLTLFPPCRRVAPQLSCVTVYLSWRHAFQFNGCLWCIMVFQFGADCCSHHHRLLSISVIDTNHCYLSMMENLGFVNCFLNYYK